MNMKYDGPAASLPGSNLNDVRIQNRALVLRMIATEGPASRVDIARMTGLTKTTASKIVSDLMAENIIYETQLEAPEGGLGRKPIYLDISPRSPCVCGLLVKRHICTGILADYKGAIIAREDYPYDDLSGADELVDILLELYRKVSAANSRPVTAIGIAAIGPVDAAEQKLANPPNFYGIANLELPAIISEKTGVPASIINDANAGALAEKVYGRSKIVDNFIYLHIMNGIGAGFILQNKIYNGDLGQSGEIGHTSINFAGPVCDCGNTGCLEMYANIDNINAKIRHMRGIYPNRSLLPDTKPYYQWQEVISAASEGDYYAISALDDFCEYLSHALANAINLLDINTIIVGYESRPEQKDLETILSKKLNSRVLTAPYREIAVRKSVFGGDAPLIGSIALVTNKFFSGQIEF